MEHTDMLSSQIVSLSWIRCLQEEGVDFVNKKTGAVERDERIIFEALETKSGLFDVPAAKASRQGFEKNILEVYGSYCLNSEDPYMLSILLSPELKERLQKAISKIKEGA